MPTSTSIRALSIGLVALFFSSLSIAQTTPADPTRVLVVYNDDWPDENANGIGDSKEVADYYAWARRVPVANLLGLNLGSSSRVRFGGSVANAWIAFHDKMVTPITTRLGVLGPGEIDTILLCYGVPHGMNTPATSFAYRAVDSLIQVPGYLGTRAGWSYSGYWSSNPYFEHSPTVPPDKGRFSHQLYKYGVSDYYLVSRIDGIHADAAMDLVDGALYFERHGSRGAGKVEGTAYIDSRHGYKSDTYLQANYPNYPGYTSYQLWSYRMAFGKLLPPKLGLPVKWEHSNYEIGERNSTGTVLAKWSDNTPAASAPDALLYFGWYNYRQYLDVWTWLPGSVACDLNSNSIQNFHDPKRTGPAFLSRAFELGLTAGCGVISEPYLSGHARTEIVLHYLIEGYTYAEAAALADPALFWRGVRIGDPLYSPFEKTLQRKADTSAPPRPTVHTIARAGAGTQVELSVRTSHRATTPELCLATLDYGPTPKLGTSKASRKAYHSRHDLIISGLDPNVPGYFGRAMVADPAGNSTVGQVIAFTPRSFTEVEARTLADPAVIKTAQDLVLRFSVAFRTSLTAATSLKIEAQLPGSGSTWFNVTDIIAAFATEVGGGQNLDCLLFTFRIPGFQGPTGSYHFKLTVATAKGLSSHSSLLTVQ